VLTRIRRQSPSSKVVVFSGMEPVDRAWMDKHVAGYVRKDSDLEYLVELLESVGRPHEAEAVLELPRSLTSVRSARRFVSQKLIEWSLDQLLDDALLVASELATNAITHADSDCRLRLSLSPGTLRIDVLDTGAGTPEPQPPSSTEEHGRGLHLVDALTTAWGLELLPGDGKLVWAELARPTARSA